MQTADGFDRAIMGAVVSCGRRETVLYSVSQILDILMERDNMTPDASLEFFELNILGSYNGEGMPAYLNDHEEPLEVDDLACN